MSDFETHPIGTHKRIAKLERENEWATEKLDEIQEAVEAFFEKQNHLLGKQKFSTNGVAQEVRDVLMYASSLGAENERAQEAFHQIKSWSEAYPLSVFPEPDFEKAHQVLTANGMTLDAISASNMRHVITQVQAIVDAATTDHLKGKNHG